MRRDNYEIIIYAIYYAKRPLIITEIHEITNHVFNIRITYHEIENTVYGNRKYFKPVKLRYPIENCRNAYKLTTSGLRIGGKIRNELAHKVHR